SGAKRVAFGLARPKSELAIGPHSPFCAKLWRSQSGTTLPLASFHERVVLLIELFNGLYCRTWPLPVIATYRPNDTLNAVLPLPKRSYAAPIRGLRSFQAGPPCTAG